MASEVIALAALALGERIRAILIVQSEGHYNEDSIKKSILSELQLIREDTKVLRQQHFQSARNTLATVLDSSDYIGSPNNIDNLKVVRANASMAFAAVEDPIDKLRALSFLISANYHVVAFTCASSSPTNNNTQREQRQQQSQRQPQDAFPNWSAGKREVQNIFKQYIGQMKELTCAVQEELRPRYRSFFGNKEKRRVLLREYCILSAAVHALYPRHENTNHPRFSLHNRAVLHAYQRNHELMWPAPVSHMIEEPMERLVLQGHSDYIYSCAVLDTNRAITGSWDGTLKVWDLARGCPVRTAYTLATDLCYGRITCCAVFDENKKAISGTTNGILIIWDLETLSNVGTIHGHDKAILCIQVYAVAATTANAICTTRAISCGLDQTLRVWDLETYRELRTLRGHTASVNCCVVFQFNGTTRALSGSNDHTLRVWDLDQHFGSEELQTLHGRDSDVNCCAAFQNGTRALSGSAHGTLTVWDLTKTDTTKGGGRRQELYSITNAHNKELRCCFILETGNNVLPENGNTTKAITASEDGSLKVWNLSDSAGIVLYTIQATKGPRGIYCCCGFSQNTRILMGSDDLLVRVWDLQS